MCGIECVVDIKGHCRWRSVAAGTVDIHHLATYADQRAQVRRIFPARNRRLAGHTDRLAGCLAKGHHESRIVPKRIEIICVLIPGSNGQHPRPQDVRKAVCHPRRVPPIRDPSGEPIRLREQQNAGIRRDCTPIECAGDFLGANDWKREQNLGRIGHGGGAISVR